MIDLHTHSKYSFDTEAEPAEITDMAQVAIRAGVDVLAVTDHYSARHRPSSATLPPFKPTLPPPVRSLTDR